MRMLGEIERWDLEPTRGVQLDSARPGELRFVGSPKVPSLMVSQSVIGHIGQAPTSPGGSNHGSDGVAFYLLRGTFGSCENAYTRSQERAAG